MGHDGEAEAPEPNAQAHPRCLAVAEEVTRGEPGSGPLTELPEHQASACLRHQQQPRIWHRQAADGLADLAPRASLAYSATVNESDFSMASPTGPPAHKRPTVPRGALTATSPVKCSWSPAVSLVPSHPLCAGAGSLPSALPGVCPRGPVPPNTARLPPLGAAGVPARASSAPTRSSARFSYGPESTRLQ